MSIESQADSLTEQPVLGRPGFPQGEERMSLMDVWRVFTKHRVLILVVTVLSVVIALIYAERTKPIYETVARIEIEPASNVGLQGLVEQQGGGSSETQLATEIRVLQSDSVLFKTAQDLNLLNLGHSAELTLPQRAAMIGLVRGGLKVTPLTGTNIVEIRYRSHDPKMAAEIVNQLMETYSDEDLRLKFERTSHVSDWLQKQLTDLQEEAANAQRQLADYQKAHNIVGSDENSNLTLQTLGQISGQLESAEADRIMKEARMRQYDSLNPDLQSLMGDDPALASLQGQLSTLQLQRTELAARLGPNHPRMKDINLQIEKVQSQIQKQIEVARQEVQAEYNGALGVEQALRGRLAVQEDEAYKLNENVAQYAILRHEAELNRDLFDTLQMRLKEASVTAGLSAANITVIDRAQVPFIPVAPRKSLSVMMGLFGGFVIGCMLAFVFESIDDRLQTSDEVESVSMLPSLAAVPHITQDAGRHKENGKNKRKDDAGTSAHAPWQTLAALVEPKSHSAEAYRGMRSSLLLSSVDKPPKIIVMTSAFPSEGKTTTAVNCAIVLAQRGERVLLVDADLRRGSLHRVFGLGDDCPNLSTVLSQPGAHWDLPAPLPELPSLHVLASGVRPPNPAEMLSSNRMEEQLREWTKEYDRVVFDTAPLLAVSDTQPLAVLADAVVLVVRAGMTRKRALIRARDLLWRINAPIAGVAVNDVDMQLEHFYTYRYGMYGYGYRYGYRYRSPYSYGYEDDEKGE